MQMYALNMLMRNGLKKNILCFKERASVGILTEIPFA